MEKLDLQSRLKPYIYKKEYVEEIFPQYMKSLLTPEAKRIILDEFSFLKEHSSILMSTKKLASHLHRWGVVLIDASNKVFDRKESLFERI